MISDSTKVTHCFMWLTAAVSFLMAGAAWLGLMETRRASELRSSQKVFFDRDFAKAEEKITELERALEVPEAQRDKEWIESIKKLRQEVRNYVQPFENLEAEIDAAEQRSTQYSRATIVLILLLYILNFLIFRHNRRENRPHIPSDEPSEPPRHLSTGE